MSNDDETEALRAAVERQFGPSEETGMPTPPKAARTAPTADEITAQVKKLTALKDKVRPTTMFGDSNREAIDAQIIVLEHRLSNDQIYDRWPDDEADLFIREHALVALYWRTGDKQFDDELLEGQEGGDLADTWKDLVRKE